jgi:hypothetical protein
MALINDDKKYIFFHLYKCGGNSFRTILSGNEYGGVHSNPKEIKQLLNSSNSNIFNDYFKFTIIRNPFDWLLSTYFYIINTSHNLNSIVKKMNFNEFLVYYVNEMMLNLNKPIGSNKVVNLFEYITDENSNVILDYVGKYENIDSEAKIICEKIGIPFHKLPLKNVNINKDKDYRKYYNSESIEFVQTYFKKDLEYFNYKF